MDQILEILLSWQFVVLCVGIFSVIQFIRIIVEYFIPSAINARWWRSLALPLLPLLLGATIGFITRKYHFAYPDVITSNSEKFLFSIGAGALSSTVVRVLREMLFNRANSNNMYQPFPIQNPFSPNPFPTNPLPPPMPSPLNSSLPSINDGYKP